MIINPYTNIEFLPRYNILLRRINDKIDIEDWNFA